MRMWDWLPIISVWIFFCFLIVYCRLVTDVWLQPQLPAGSSGSQLVVATDAAHGVICYRFELANGIYCLKNTK